MTNKEAKHQIFMEAHERWLANQAKHYGYNENCGKYQDDLNEMVWADWDFTEAHEKLWRDYTLYFEEGVNPYKAKLCLLCIFVRVIYKVQKRRTKQ